MDELAVHMKLPDGMRPTVQQTLGVLGALATVSFATGDLKAGIVMLSDQTGHFEAIVFSEGLARLRDILEPGRAVKRCSNAVSG